MTILVTGGLGYLGSRLIRDIPHHPISDGKSIRILDNLRQPRYHSLWNLPAYEDYQFIEGDIREPETRLDAVEGVHTVYHLAAITNAPETFDIPEETWDVNYNAAMELFEDARDAGVSEFVNVSTCSVYGRTQDEITEEFECDPESPYAKAKLEAEQDMLTSPSDGMGFTALRLGTVYGWTRGMRFDTVVDKFAYLAASGQPLTVYRGAEDQQRPYLHVRDAVRSMMFAVERLGDGEVYNVVGENGRLQDVVDCISRHFVDVDIEYTEVEHLNQLSYIVSDDKIRSKGFQTCYSMDQGVAELADKFRGLIDT